VEEVRTVEEEAAAACGTSTRRIFVGFSGSEKPSEGDWQQQSLEGCVS
jgi:hypothetical protein